MRSDAQDFCSCGHWRRDHKDGPCSVESTVEGERFYCPCTAFEGAGPKPLHTVYLGDGLYASFDGFQLRLYASDGIRDTNEVFLDSDTLASLLQFVEFIKEKRR